MTNQYSSHVSLSRTVTCNLCNQSLALCSCPPTTFTGNVSATFANFSSGGVHSGGYNYNTYQFLTCSSCGNSLNSCACSSYAPLTPNISPFQTPVIMPSGGTSAWTTWTTSLQEQEKISDFIVRGVQTPEEYPATGDLTVLHFDKTEGLYLKGTSLVLPIEFKDCFFKLRQTGGYNLWQLRSPISFRIDLAHKDAPQRQPHFFTVADIEGVTIKGDKLVEVANPFFQEITDQLELIRLVEIQDTFVKLLRRL